MRTIPSLPGYGFSTRPARPVAYRDTAALWHRLMRGLGYRRYGAHGGDFGGGDLDARFSRDFLLTLVTLYWVTQTITPSLRDYFDNRWSHAPLRPDDFVRVPTAVAVFANQFVSVGLPPAEWAGRLYNVRRWTVMPSGGHFAPAEEPHHVARDLAAFFGDLVSRA